jgi:hypothetical protein
MKTTDKQSLLLKKFHTICSIAGIKKEAKDLMVASFGVESSRDLNEKQLSELIDAINREPEQWRKRVMASIGAWLRAINKTDSADVIKGIACRAAQLEKFNSIPVSRLRDIYYEFSKKAKTVQTTQMVKADEINYLSSQN